MTVRVLIAVTHLLGAGHLVRAAAIGRGLARAGHEVTLVTGGRPTGLTAEPNLTIVQLAPVRAEGDTFRMLLDESGDVAKPSRLTARREQLLDALHRTHPDVVVTELYPFGRRVLSAEFRALVEASHALSPRPLLLCSLRDILVAPAKHEKVADAHRMVRDCYDAVLVHADPRLVSLEASWPVEPDLASRLLYTGYVDAEPETQHPTAVKIERDDHTVLVSGGSSAAALPLYRAAIEAAAIVPERRWTVLVGRGVGQADFDALRSLVPPNLTLEWARPDFRTLLRKAGVFVGQAGYNTVMDLLATGPRAVLVPFERGSETEQRLRAERLVGKGIGTLLPEGDLSGSSLAGAVRASGGVVEVPRLEVACDGVDETRRIIERLAAGRRLGGTPRRAEAAR